MSFGEAVTSVFSQYAEFSGRARRSEYWYFVLFNLILNVVVSAIVRVTGISILSSIVSLALFIPGLAVSIRRLHDVGRSGWSLLFGLIPLIGIIFLIVWYCSDSEAGSNQYGPNPKGL